MTIRIAHHSGRNPGTRIRHGHLRFSYGMIESGVTSVSGDPPPDPCCADDPSDFLNLLADDLVSFFDKWYGNACQTTVGGYYVWVGCACGDPGVRVATDAQILAARDDLCGENPLIFEVFNYFRDAIKFMSTIQIGTSALKRRPGAETAPVSANQCDVACPSLAPFRIGFTRTRPCDHPAACAFTGIVSKDINARVRPGEKLCLAHYVELQEIVDDIMDNGVVEFVASVRPATPCVGTSEGLVCVKTLTTTYAEGDPLNDCCASGDVNGCYCCLGPDPSVTDFFEESYWGVFDGGDSLSACEQADPSCYTRNDGCYNSPLRDNAPKFDACLYEYQSITQDGVSVFNEGNCTIDIPVLVYTRRLAFPFGTPEFCDVLDEHTQSRTMTMFYSQVNNRGSCGWTTFPGGYLFGNECFDYPEDRSSNGCTGVITDYLEGCCEECQDCRTIHQWWYRTFTMIPDTSSCDSECNGTGCPCPGSATGPVTTSSEVDVAIAQPSTSKVRIGECGEGYDIVNSLEFQIQFGESCPDSGLTNIVMLDPRIGGTVDGTWRTKSVAAPTVSDPDCPGLSTKTCDPLCLIGYGELA